MSEQRIWADDDPHSRAEKTDAAAPDAEPPAVEDAEPYAVEDAEPSAVETAEPYAEPPAVETATRPRAAHDVRPGPRSMGHVPEHDDDDWWRVWLRRTVIALGATLVLASLLVWAWVGGLHGGPPRDVPVAVIAGDRTALGAVLAVQRDNGSLTPVGYSSAAAADKALSRREVSAILASDATGVLGGLNLAVASANGPDVANAVVANVTAVANTANLPLAIVDIHPVGAGDPNGTTPFWITMAWVIGGALAAIILGVALGTVPRDLDRLALRLGALAVFSLLLGLIGALFATMVWTSHWFGLWLTGALITFTAALIASALQGWLGLWGIALTAVLLLVLGVPGAGGIVPPEMLPGFFRGGQWWLPTGLGTDLVRGLEYFGRRANAWPITGLTLWALASIAALVGSTVVLGKHARERGAATMGGIGEPDTVTL